MWLKSSEAYIYKNSISQLYVDTKKHIEAYAIIVQSSLTSLF
jgi:hypothetical protein